MHVRGRAKGETKLSSLMWEKGNIRACRARERGLLGLALREVGLQACWAAWPGLLRSILGAFGLKIRHWAGPTYGLNKNENNNDNNE